MLLSHDLREVFNGLRWLVRAGAPLWMQPNDLPPWEAVSRQSQRRLAAGCCAWVTRFWRFVRDDKRLPATLAGLDFVAFARLLLPRP